MAHDHVLRSSSFPCLAVPFLISSKSLKANHARNAQWKDPANPLELAELLDRLAGPGKHAENVEPHSLAQRPALANGNLVTLLNTESRRHVRGEVLVTLLIPVVLGDVVEVFATDDDGTVHLGRDNGAGQDTAADGNHAGEGALLVDVLALNGSDRGPETQTNVLVPSPTALTRPGRLDLGLAVEEDVRLLLESALALDGQFGSHLVGWAWTKMYWCRGAVVEILGIFAY
jgi:hypothetical protein